MLSKIKLMLFVGITVVVCGLFTAWRVTASNLATTKHDLQIAEASLTALKKENKNLAEYMKKRDDAIKDLERKYHDALNNIPSDICGDIKPSKELLEYFRNL